MKIELEVPDWAGDSNLWLLMETEPVAYKLKDGDWFVKTSRCSVCGRCCMDLDSRSIFGARPDGSCPNLVKEAGENGNHVCKLGLFRPVHCSISTRNMDGCTVRYEKAR